jgi:hypothetical protein
VHPIERLRFVARAGRSEGDDSLLAQETAWALAALGDDQAGLVTACRRILDRHPGAGALWWLASRVLTAGDPAAEARRVADELDADPTGDHLAVALPDDATVCFVGIADLVGPAIARRRDLRVLLVDIEDVRYRRPGRRGDRAATEPERVPGRGLGAAAAAADVVVFEASALFIEGAIAPAGCRAAAAVARHAGVDVWAVAGRGRVLPSRLGRALLERLVASSRLDEPWDAPDELVPLDLIDRVVAPTGPAAPADVLADIDCPIAPELLRAPPR